MDEYQKFIYYRTYSRWNDELKRRENWDETVDRYLKFMHNKLGDKLNQEEYKDIRNHIINMEVMPSMRLMWSAGKACEKTNVTAYNCSYIAPTKLQDFGEILYLLTCGCGVGFSVEKEVVGNLPEIWIQSGDVSLFRIPDSREGWADALVYGLEKWFNGEDVEFDYSLIRPAGAILKTMGGRSSGAEPLRDLLKFARQTVLNAQGRKLRPIEVHDIVCKIGEVVVSGGVRRSSEISLSDLNDVEMREAKSGEFWNENKQRFLANNSAVYNEKPSKEELRKEWESLKNSGTGERGIFNRGNLPQHMPQRREFVKWMGVNPCGEITLRSKQFCNLSEVVCRENDTLEDLKRKIRIATIIGTYQSSLTNFQYLSEEWKKNCDEERLLGVSLTGIFDSEVVRDEKVLQELREIAIETNKEFAKKFGINESKSITCIKPSGTVSQLVNSSSGLHPRYSEYYIRHVRISATDPLFKLLKDIGYTYYPEVGQEDNPYTYVIPFPIKSPNNAIINITALEQLEYWKMFKLNFTEHNPSTTIYIEENEWDNVFEWIWDNWEIVGGLSFLPKSTHIYKLAPYTPISKEEYEELKKETPEIDFSLLTKYELEDMTEGSKALACMGQVCEIA